MAGKTTHLKTAQHPDQDETDIYVWRGGIPTVEEIDSAPMFTVFPGPSVPGGKLPTGEFYVDDGQQYDVWFIGEGDESYADSSADIMEASGLLKGSEWEHTYRLIHTPVIDDQEKGKTVEFGRGPVRIQADSQTWPWAIDVGYSLVKVPDDLRSPYYRLYVLDDMPKDYEFRQRQIPGVAPLLLAKGARVRPASQALKGINAYRRSRGLPALDPVAAGWTPHDVELEAARLGLSYNNPDRAALKRKLMGGRP